LYPFILSILLGLGICLPLHGQIQTFPAAPSQSPGFNTTIIITPSGIGGWRYLGEPFWRASGSSSGTFRKGDHAIEFRPAAGYLQPPPETLPEATVNNTISRNYVATPASEGGSLGITLKPDTIAAASVPVANRAQWRLLGENETQWRDSGAAIAGLVQGTHLIECKPLAGRTTPGPVAVSITENQARARVITYFAADGSSGTAPVPVPFDAVATDQTKPYAFVGQIRSDAGTGSGFVIKPRVVVTAAHNVFDDATLSAVTGVRFLFRRDSAAYEPAPLVPRASFILDDYASKRASENTPGTFAPTSLDSDVATIYFDDDIDPVIESGYLASDAADNPFLLSSADKTLVGYPMDGGIPANSGRMHATPIANLSFSLLFGKTFASTGIRGGYGVAGGPLCVEHDFGNGTRAFFPAAIHVGSSGGQTVVRAIDSRVIELFNWADRNANGGSGPPTPGATLVSLTGNLTTTEPGSLKVIIEPASARTAGAGWLLNPETLFRQSDAQKSGLAPGSYGLMLKAISGFLQPSAQTVAISGGQLTTLTITYQSATPLDTWRQANFQTTSNTGDAADSADPDKDGVKNIDEYTAGTNPKSGSDLLQIKNPTKTGGTFTATTAGKSGRIYKLQRNPTLIGTWTTVATQTTLASDQTVNLTDTSAPAGSAYYRIEVSLPP